MSEGNFSWGNVLVIIGMTAAATWNVAGMGTKNLEEKVATYEKSESWKLPETLIKINSATEKLDLSLDERNKFNSNNQTIVELTKKNDLLNKSLDEKNSELDIAIRQLKILTKKDEKFTLNVDESYALVPNEVVVAVRSIDYLSITISLNSTPYNMYAGDSKEYNFGSEKCKLIVTKIDRKNMSVEFSNSCQ